MQLDPATQRLTHGMPSTTSKLLRRRYFLTEKAKDANIIGADYLCKMCFHNHEKTSGA